MDAKAILESVEAIQNNFLGYRPGTGFESEPGPTADVRIARGVYWLES